MPVIVFRVATEPPVSTSTWTPLSACAEMGSSEFNVNRVSIIPEALVATCGKSTHF